MTIIILIIVAALLLLIGTIYYLGTQDTGYRINSRKNLVFIALKNADTPLPLRVGALIVWQSKGDLPLIGTPNGDGMAPYWDHFLIVDVKDGDPNPFTNMNGGAEDAYIAKLKTTQIPAFVPGLLRFLHVTGLRRAPKEVELEDDMFDTLARPEILPNKESADALLAGPPADRPAMVNFLKYYDRARYASSLDGGTSNRDGGTGAQAYNRYGVRAMEAVYRVGGNLVLYGHVDETIHASDHAPTREAWDDIAIMQYPNRKAILTMEQWDRYKAGFRHRDAGVDQTRLVSSYPNEN